MSKRHKFFFIFSVLLLTAVLGRMLFLAGTPGNDLRRSAEKISCKTGKLTAIRGRIFDKDDTLLAWSERCYDLIIKSQLHDPKKTAQLSAKLQKTFKISQDLTNISSGDLPLTIKYNLTAEELAEADKLAEKYSELDIDLRWERRHAKAIPQLGEVRQIDGMEYGISGWEKEFDRQLQGTPGTFTVMLDRHGKWINSTFRIKTPARSGEDIYISEDCSGEEAE